MEKITDIAFPHLGIEIESLTSYLDVFGFKIMFYGMLIGLGMILAIVIVGRNAKKEGIDPEVVTDMAIWAIPIGIVCARIYYVIFSWDYYSKDLLQIFNLRGGGLAIYGGAIGGVTTVIVFCIVKKISPMRMVDIAIPGLILGQAIGRWGNFFNCEAFGGFTDSIFAMRINRDIVSSSMITEELNQAMQANLPELAADYIQVHPTFLYESICDFAIFAVLMIYRKHRRFDGANLCLYMTGYGIARFFIERLRTDQLKIAGTNLAVSQWLSLLLVIAGVGLFIFGNIYVTKHPEKKVAIPVPDPERYRMGKKDKKTKENSEKTTEETTEKTTEE